MTAPATNRLRLVDLHPERDTGQTVSLVDGKLVLSDPGLEVLLSRFRMAFDSDAQIFANLKGYGNGYYVFKP